MEGYIKLFRQITDWEWYSDIPTCRLFIHLLLKVNYTDRNWQGKKIERGSCITSFASLSSETGLSVEQLKRALKNLQKTGEIKKISTNQNTLIIVTKYDDYQGCSVENNNQTTNEQHTENNPKTNEQQTGNKQTTTNKESKNIKKDKKDNNLYCSSDEEPEDDYKYIIDVLNLEADKDFSYKVNKTKSLIKARMNEGFVVDDFVKVIQKMCDKWNDDPSMKRYLRPSTLFGPKFDEFLNEGD